MFDQRFAWTSAALVVIVTLAFLMTRAPQKVDIAPITETVSGVERPANSEKPPEYAYLMKEHDGHVAVYAAGQDEPELVLNVLVKHLPDYDRAQLQQGIPVKDYSELVALMEDYSS